MKKGYIVARCSTNAEKQDVTRQTKELTAKYSNQFNIAGEYAYYESGTKNKKDLSKILTYCINNDIDTIIVSEISRISRKVVGVLQFIEECTQHQINVLIDNYQLNSLNQDKTENITTKMMLTIGASFAEMELKQTQQRLNSGRKKYILEGGTLGRSKGTEETKEAFLNKHKDVQKELKAELSIRKISLITHKSTTTIQKVKKLILQKPNEK